MEIIEQKQNKLLHRLEVEAKIQADITPSNKEVAKMLGEKLGKAEENVVVEHIKGQFGSHEFHIFAKVYDDVESKDKYEVVSKKERKKIAEEKKKAEEEAKKVKEEAKKVEESPVEEEKKEEAVVEEKPVEEKPVEKVSKPGEEEKIDEKPSEAPVQEPEEAEKSVDEKANPEEEPKSEVKVEGEAQ